MADPMLMNKISKLDQYFKRMSAKTAEEVIEEADKKEEMFKEIGIRVRDDFQSFKEDLKEKIRLMKNKESEGKSKQKPLSESKVQTVAETEANLISSMQQMHALSQKIAQFHPDDIELPTVSRKSMMSKNFNFKSPLRLMNNKEFIGEFNALFGNMWGMYERNELRMTEVSKQAKLERAQAKLAILPDDLKPMYAKIYLIVAALLQDIETCASIHHETHELSYEIDKLFSVSASSRQNIEILGMLQPQSGEFIKEPDLDRIFR
jgi:hypothetical protein